MPFSHVDDQGRLKLTVWFKLARGLFGLGVLLLGRAPIWNNSGGELDRVNNFPVIVHKSSYVEDIPHQSVDRVSVRVMGNSRMRCSRSQNNIQVVIDPCFPPRISISFAGIV